MYNIVYRWYTAHAIIQTKRIIRHISLLIVVGTCVEKIVTFLFFSLFLYYVFFE